MRIVIVVLISVVLSACASMAKTERSPAGTVNPCPNGADFVDGMCISNVPSPCPSAAYYSNLAMACRSLENIIMVPKIMNGHVQSCPMGYENVGVGFSPDLKNSWACKATDK